MGWGEAVGRGGAVGGSGPVAHAERPKIGLESVRVAPELLRGEAGGLPIRDQQPPIAQAVRLPPLDSQVRGTSVELDRDALPPPQAIDRDEAAAELERGVELWTLEAAGFEEAQEALLERAPGDAEARVVRGQDYPQGPDPAAARIALDQVG